MKKILLLVGVMMMLFSYGQNRSDYYWSGYGSSDDISDGINWWTDGNPSSGDNLYFNNTEGVRHWAYSNYGVGSYFGSLITYNGAGGIKFYGDNTYAYKFENNSDVELFELSPNSAAEGSREIGNRIDNNLEINPVGSGGILVSCDKISMDNTNGSRTLKVYGGNTLTIDGFIYEKNGTGASFQLLGSATVIIKGNSTYTGATTVSGGTLELQGSIASSAVTVESGATLKINGDDVTLASLDVEPGGVVTIEAGKSLTVTGVFSNSGTVTVKSTSSGTGSLIVDGTVIGDVTVERYIAAWTDDEHGWHFVSSPVASQSISTEFVDITATPISNSVDFYRWSEPLGLWINIKKELDGSYNQGAEESNFSNIDDPKFDVGQGYMISYQANNTKGFTGTLNSGDVTVTGLDYTEASSSSGWNLVGNPYPSAIEWNSDDWTLPATISGNCQVWDETNAAFVVIGADGIIPAMNGFMVYTSDNNNSLTIPAAARIHSSTNWYKNSKEGEQYVKIVAKDLEGSTAQESVVNFYSEATSGFDMKFDSYFLPGYAPMLYSVSEDGNYAWNTLPEFNTDLTLPMGFTKNSKNSFALSLKENSIGSSVFIFDKQTGENHSFDNGDYYFTASQNDDPNRFVLHFGTLTGMEDQVSAPKAFAYINGNNLHILNMEGDYTLRLNDISGRRILEQQINGNAEIALPSALNTGIYIIEMTSENQRFTQKLFVR